MEYHLKVLGPSEGEFFCLGSALEQNYDYWPAEKKGMEVYFEGIAFGVSSFLFILLLFTNQKKKGKKKWMEYTE